MMFKTGDKAIITKCIDYPMHEGKKATVVFVDELDSKLPYKVKIEEMERSLWIGGLKADSDILKKPRKLKFLS